MVSYFLILSYLLAAALSPSFAIKNSFAESDCLQQQLRNALTQRKYETTEMCDLCDFPGSRKGGSIRSDLEISIRDNHLFDQSGKNVIDEMSASPSPWIFVMDGEGKIYAGRVAFHHTGFLGGRPTAAAGELRTIRNTSGQPVLVFKDQSGHYLPKPIHAKQFLLELDARGFDLNKVLVDLVPLHGLQLQKASEILKWAKADDPKMLSFLKHVMETSTYPLTERSIAGAKLFLANNDVKALKTLFDNKLGIEAISFLAKNSNTLPRQQLDTLVSFLGTNIRTFDETTKIAARKFLSSLVKEKTINTVKSYESFPDRAIPEIIELLRSPDDSIRLTTLDTLQKTRYYRDPDPLLTALNSASSSFRPATTQKVNHFIESERARISSKTVISAYFKNPHATAPELFGKLSHENEIIRKQALLLTETSIINEELRAPLISFIEQRIQALPSPVKAEMEAYLERICIEKANRVLDGLRLTSTEGRLAGFSRIEKILKSPYEREAITLANKLLVTPRHEELDLFLKTLVEQNKLELSPEVLKILKKVP